MTGKSYDAREAEENWSKIYFRELKKLNKMTRSEKQRRKFIDASNINEKKMKKKEKKFRAFIYAENFSEI